MLLVTVIKLRAYKILIVEGYFIFFQFSSFNFQDLCVVAVLVVIGRHIHMIYFSHSASWEKKNHFEKKQINEYRSKEINSILRYK